MATASSRLTRRLYLMYNWVHPAGTVGAFKQLHGQ